jgi:hypothetical protein
MAAVIIRKKRGSATNPNNSLAGNSLAGNSLNGKEKIPPTSQIEEDLLLSVLSAGK